MGYVVNDPGFESWQGKEIVLFSKTSREALEPTYPFVQWVKLNVQAIQLLAWIPPKASRR